MHNKHEIQNGVLSTSWDSCKDVMVLTPLGSSSEISSTSHQVRLGEFGFTCQAETKVDYLNNQRLRSCSQRVYCLLWEAGTVTESWPQCPWMPIKPAMTPLRSVVRSDKSSEGGRGMIYKGESEWKKTSGLAAFQAVAKEPTTSGRWLILR